MFGLALLEANGDCIEAVVAKRLRSGGKDHSSRRLRCGQA
jgi:hypothetical protein